MTDPSRSQDASPDEVMFQTLVAAHFDDVWRFVRRRCSSSEDADDVTSETFAVAWRRRADLPGDQSRLWLFGAARRVLSNQQRSLHRQERLRLRLAQTMLPEAAHDVRPRPEGSLWVALASLSSEDRELLIMRAWDELPVTEMAALLGCSPNAVSLRLHKARSRLAEELERKERDGARHVMADPRQAKEDDRDQQR